MRAAAAVGALAEMEVLLRPLETLAVLAVAVLVAMEGTSLLQLAI
jgi:hypothetical protein